MRDPIFRAILSLAFVAGISAQATAQVKAGEMKQVTRTISGTFPYKGIVGEIDADHMTLVETTDRGQVKEHVFAPIDLLRKGEMLSNVWGSYAYRWQDVKAGDTLSVEVAWDPKDKVMYCLEIKIELRPKDKLPKSQKPNEDRHFAARSVFNDIENGLDVSDEVLKKTFPPEFIKDPKTGTKTPVEPGPVYLGFMKKLAANREKIAKEKDKDLKATPPEKK